MSPAEQLEINAFVGEFLKLIWMIFQTRVPGKSYNFQELLISFGVLYLGIKIVQQMLHLNDGDVNYARHRERRDRYERDRRK